MRSVNVIPYRCVSPQCMTQSHSGLAYSPPPAGGRAKVVQRPEQPQLARSLDHLRGPLLFRQLAGTETHLARKRTTEEQRDFLT